MNGLPTAMVIQSFDIKDKDGGFSITTSRDFKLWIKRIECDAHGEGMEIEASQLLEVIRKFYNDKF